jgi:hypothetical protein
LTFNINIDNLTKNKYYGGTHGAADTPQIYGRWGNFRPFGRASAGAGQTGGKMADGGQLP